MNKVIHTSRGRWNKEQHNNYMTSKIIESGIWNSNPKIKNGSNDLFFILGLSRSQDKTLMGLTLDQPAFPVDKERYHQVFVYCDFIEPQYVGKTKAPLLRCFQLFDLRQKFSTIENMPIRPPAVFIKCLIVCRSKNSDRETYT